MKNKLFTAIALFAIVLIFANCKGVSKEEEAMPSDSVALNTMKLSDTVSFKLNQGGKCDILANATIAYPNKYKDKSTTEKLQKLFATVVLEAGDSVSFKDALKEYPNVILNQYGPTNDISQVSDYEDDDENSDNDKYNSSVNISVIYNKNDIITFCKEEVKMKNGEVAMKTHSYYNFDLQTIALIDLSNMFKETSLNDICQLLKNQLLAQNNVKTEDELNDLGYYNLDNLTVSNNFYFTDDAVIWCYSPLEVAVSALGEPKISLDYDTLNPYFSDNSILNRFD
jgi:hypothetical protein